MRTIAPSRASPITAESPKVRRRRVTQEVFPVPPQWADRALMTAQRYAEAVERVETEPDAFWRSLADRLTWITPPTGTKDVSFDKADFHIRWFWDGVLNVSANCLDRHLPA